MKRNYFTILIVILASFFVWFFFFKADITDYNENQEDLTKNNEYSLNNWNEDNESGERTTIVAQNLDTPWSLAFLLSGEILITERGGSVRLIDSQGNLQEEPVIEIGEVYEIGEGGLLGITPHPQFEENSFVYLYYTYQDQNNETLNKVVRMSFSDNSLVNPETIIDSLPGASNHNGGRIKFGPDNNLYITTGDAQNSNSAQDLSDLGGKILRLTDEGEIAPDNPFNSEVYSYGHRNSQGLAWDSEGRLWATEHGRSGISSGLDELNLVESGNNYGWPEIQGDETREGMVGPMIHSGARDTWAPSGAAYYDNSIFFTGLRGEALYRADISGEDISVTEYFKGEFGRIRDVVLGLDNFLYIITNNTDGRGSIQSGDDKLIRINTEML